MAFKAAYPERLAQCGDEVFVSLGWDAEGRRTAIQEAVRTALLPRHGRIGFAAYQQRTSASR